MSVSYLDRVRALSEASVRKCHRAFTDVAFAPVIALCRELGLCPPWARPLWTALGL